MDDPKWDLVLLLLDLTHLAFIHYQLQCLTWTPNTIYIIIDTDVHSLQSMFKEYPFNIQFVSFKRFPFTINQISHASHNEKNAIEYKQHLVWLYASEVLLELSPYYLIIKKNTLLVTNKWEYKLFDEKKLPNYSVSHGIYLPNIQHMNKLHPDLKKYLAYSAKSSFFILETECVREMIDFITDNHKTKPFWKIYTEALDPYNASIDADPMEIYLNYMQWKHPNTFSMSVNLWNTPKTITESQFYDDKLVGGCYKYNNIDFKSLFYTGPIKHWNITYQLNSLQSYLTILKQMRNTLDKKECKWVDVGCGNFFETYISLPFLTDNYIGIDINSYYIHFNKTICKQRYPNTSLIFEEMDFTNNVLPDGDICIIKNVLSYLSYMQIFSLLRQLKKYTIVVITEELSYCRLNKDNDSTYYPRMNGLWIDEDPFNIPVKSLLSIPMNNKKLWRTVVWRP